VGRCLVHPRALPVVLQVLWHRCSCQQQQ
jgi:hypothetical protein